MTSGRWRGRRRLTVAGRREPVRSEGERELRQVFAGPGTDAVDSSQPGTEEGCGLPS